MSKLNNMGIFCAKTQYKVHSKLDSLLRFAKKAQKRLEFGSKPKTKHIVDWILDCILLKKSTNGGLKI